MVNLGATLIEYKQGEGSEAWQDELHHFLGYVGRLEVRPLLAIALLWLAVAPWPDTEATRQKRKYFRDRALGLDERF